MQKRQSPDFKSSVVCILRKTWVSDFIFLIILVAYFRDIWLLACSHVPWISFQTFFFFYPISTQNLSLLKRHSMDWYSKNKMPFCTTKTWNFLVTHYLLWRNCRMCSPKILLLVFLFAFIFFTAAHFHLAGRSFLVASISHFLTAAMKSSGFFSNEILLLCF